MFDDTRKKSSKRETFLKGLKSSRVDREAEKQRKNASVKIQSQVRRWIAVKQTVLSFREDLDVKIANIELLKRTLVKAGKASAFRVPKAIFLKLLQQLFFAHACPVQWKHNREQAASKDRSRLGSLAVLMVADIESGERCYVAIPENLEDKKVLRNVFERFERLIYGQVILSLLDGDEDTFDSLFRCIQTLQRASVLSWFAKEARPVLENRWWNSQELLLMESFTRQLSCLDESKRAAFTSWQFGSLDKLFRLTCALCRIRVESGLLVTAVLSVPNLFRLISTNSETWQSSSFAHLLNDSLKLSLQQSTYPRNGEQKVFVLANVLRFVSCLQDVEVLKVCLQTIVIYTSELLLMIGGVYEGSDMLLWEERGRTKSATKLEDTTKVDLRVLVEEKSFLRRSLEISAKLDFNDKQLSAYHAHLEQRWEVIQGQLQLETNIQPSLDPASKSYLQAFTDLWQSGSLAKKMGRSRSSKSKNRTNAAKVLRNTSDASRALARGKDTSLLVSIAKVISVFLSKVRPSPSNRWRQSMLNLLSFGCENVVETLWMTLQLSYPSALKALESYDHTKWREHEEAVHLFHVLGAVFNQLLMVIDDSELYDQHRPLHRASIQALAQFCKHFLFSGWTFSPPDAMKENSLGLACLEEVTSLMLSLHERNSRRPLCKIDDWIVKELKDYSSLERLRLDDAATFKTILSKIPYVVPFKTRVKIFRKWITLEKQNTQGEGKPKLQITVHRQRMFQDGFQQLERLRKAIRRRMYITFVNEFGQREAGIDAGGLFKEFWTTLSKIVFNPEYGLFQCRTSNELAPSADSAHLHSNHLELFEFVGLIVGKALYENIIIQPTFAHTFLSRMLGKVNHLHELAYYDAEHYKSLLYIKSFQGSDKDFQDLSLSFSVTVEHLGHYQEVDLIPNGRNIPVTRATRLKYITRVGNYYLNLRTRQQTEAFRKGFFHCVNLEWISIFSQPELQVLISGKQNAAFNLKDLKSHSRVMQSRSFSLDRIHVSRFWKIMEEFSNEERTRVLKFVTSCEREPLLGFAELDPPFTIQIIPIKSDKEKLPTASTCFNVLKLPTYSEKRIMKQKLLVAINSESGFEMS